MYIVFLIPVPLHRFVNQCVWSGNVIIVAAVCRHLQIDNEPNQQYKKNKIKNLQIIHQSDTNARIELRARFSNVFLCLFINNSSSVEIQRLQYQANQNVNWNRNNSTATRS